MRSLILLLILISYKSIYAKTLAIHFIGSLGKDRNDLAGSGTSFPFLLAVMVVQASSTWGREGEVVLYMSKHYKHLTSG